ncbi:MAG TPA: redoxin domain-containing protein [Candidatus Eisenbacteria bacterium]|jgi:peroxiredoxin|nr:redoxin domain-containing protein [Candidatus Eisenbacteria bacterium]
MPAPPFTLKGAAGQPVSLADYRGKQNVVIAFYPLAFSPVCSHQLPELEAVRPRIEALDGVLLGVSVDSWYANEAFARRLGVGFQLLSDFFHEASRAYGVFLEARNYSARALFVVDKQGQLAHVEVTPRLDDVPSEEAVIAVLERLQSQR